MSLQQKLCTFVFHRYDFHLTKVYLIIYPGSLFKYQTSEILNYQHNNYCSKNHLILCHTKTTPSIVHFVVRLSTKKKCDSFNGIFSCHNFSRWRLVSHHFSTTNFRVFENSLGRRRGGQNQQRSSSRFISIYHISCKLNTTAFLINNHCHNIQCVIPVAVTSRLFFAADDSTFVCRFVCEFV